MQDEAIPAGCCQCGCGGRTEIATYTDRRWDIVKGQPRNWLPRHRFRGRLNPAWKDNPGYQGIHLWLRRNWPKEGKCEECGLEGRTHYANISGEYRRDRNDYRELCQSCHFRFDVDRGTWGTSPQSDRRRWLAGESMRRTW